MTLHHNVSGDLPSVLASIKTPFPGETTSPETTLGCGGAAFGPFESTRRRPRRSFRAKRCLLRRSLQAMWITRRWAGGGGRASHASPSATFRSPARTPSGARGDVGSARIAANVLHGTRGINTPDERRRVNVRPVLPAARYSEAPTPSWSSAVLSADCPRFEPSADNSPLRMSSSRVSGGILVGSRTATPRFTR